jgi:hypothetical protein
MKYSQEIRTKVLKEEIKIILNNKLDSIRRKKISKLRALIGKINLDLKRSRSR